MTWSAPLNKHGQPCRVCREDRLCAYHRPKPEAPTGRPSKLAPEVQAKIVQALAGGNYRNVAAGYAGITAKTLIDWMNRGEVDEANDDSTPFRAFRKSVLEAEEKAHVRAVALIQKHAEKDPKAAQWWLERKHPDQWGRKDKLSLEGPNGGPIRTDGSLEVRIVDVRNLAPVAIEEKVPVPEKAPTEEPKP